MSLLRRLRLKTRNFRQDETGSMAAEGVIAALFLSWWYVSSFQIFDAFKQKSVNTKAAYTIADMLSRETGPTATDPNSTQINQAYVNGLNKMFDYLTYSRKPTWIRVSSVYFADDDNKYRVDWSATSGTGHPAMTTPMLASYRNKLPALPPGDSVVLVETFMAYEPIFNMGLTAHIYTTFITTAPRFASCIPWQNGNCGNDNAGHWVNPDVTDPFWVNG